MAFSPDGTKLALASEGGTLAILSWPASALLQTISIGTNVTSCRFSSSGDLVAAGSLDGVIRLWRVSDWGLERALTNDAPVLNLQLVAGSQGLVCGDVTGRLTQWRADDGWCCPETRVAHSGSVKGLCTGALTNLLVSGSATGEIKVWDGGAMSEPRVLSGHLGRIASATQSPDGSWVASTSDDGTTRLWDGTASELLCRTLSGHTNQVSALAVSPNANLVATGGGCLDGTINLFRPTDGMVARSFLAHTNGVNSLAFAPDGASLASSSDSSEARICIWSTADWSLLSTLPGPPAGASQLAFSRNGTYLFGAENRGDGDIVRWTLTNSAYNAIDRGHYGGVQCLAVDATGGFLASSGRRPTTTKVWRVADLSLVTSLPDSASALAFSPDGKLLAVAAADQIKFWRTADWQLAHSESRTGARPSSLAFSPGGQFLLIGQEDGSLLRTQTSVASPVQVELAVSVQKSGARAVHIDNVSWSPFARLLVSSDLSSWTEAARLVITSRYVDVPDYSPGGESVRFYRLEVPE
jgi:WD40 repeat protein